MQGKNVVETSPRPGRSRFESLSLSEGRWFTTKSAGMWEFLRHFRTYVQCHVIAEAFADTPGAASSYDGIAEVCADSLDEVQRAFAEPCYLEVIRPDEHKFLDLANCVFMVTEEVP